MKERKKEWEEEKYKKELNNPENGRKGKWGYRGEERKSVSETKKEWEEEKYKKEKESQGYAEIDR